MIARDDPWDIGDGWIDDTVHFILDKNSQEETPPFLPKYINNPEHPFFTQSWRSKGFDRQLKYFMSDDELNNFEHTKKNLSLNWKYHTKKIVYDLNNSGYRTNNWNEINWKDSIVLFGCSCMFGVGVAEDETVAYYLEQKIGKPVINLAYPGGSNHLIINNLVALINKFGTPSGIGIHWTESSRSLHFDKDDYYDLGRWALDDNKVKKNLFVNKYTNRYAEIAETYYIGQMAKSICKDKVKLVESSWRNHVSYAMRARFFGNDCLARDLQHPGNDVNINISNYYYEVLK